MSKQWILANLDTVVTCLTVGLTLTLILSIDSWFTVHGIRLRLKKLEGQSTDTTT